jgi:hypothetical protein
MAFVDGADQTAVGGDRDLRVGVLGEDVRGLVDGLTLVDRRQRRLEAIDHEIPRGEALRIEEALLAHPVGVVHLAEIARAVIVEHHHHRLAGLESIGQLDQAGHGRPG